MKMRRLIERIREWWRGRKLANGPCTECRTGPVFILFADAALCSECYLQAMKDWLRKHRKEEADGC